MTGELRRSRQNRGAKIEKQSIQLGTREREKRTLVDIGSASSGPPLTRLSLTRIILLDVKAVFMQRQFHEWTYKTRTLGYSDWRTPGEVSSLALW
jgi:hypothetical protein